MFKKISQFRHEELPEIGGFVKVSFSRDIEDFTAFSSIFSTEYIPGFQGSINNATEAISTDDKTKLLKNLTRKMNTKVKNSRTLVSKIDFFLKRAKGRLDINYEDFGLKNFRASINSRNIEGFLANAQSVLNHVVRNHDVLIEVGYKISLSDNLQTLITTVHSENQQQNILINEKEAQTLEKNQKLNILWSYISEVCEAGKLIYRDDFPEKLSDYTYTELKKRVRYNA